MNADQFSFIGMCQVSVCMRACLSFCTEKIKIVKNEIKYFCNGIFI